jgi:hypothetical protein
MWLDSKTTRPSVPALETPSQVRQRITGTGKSLQHTATSKQSGAIMKDGDENRGSKRRMNG